MDLVHRSRCCAAGRGPAGMARIFEHAAGQHAAALGAGIGHLRASGQAWMLSQLGMHARRWPEPGEPIEVLTWPSRRTAGARAWREFEIRSDAGDLVVEAASVWLIVDLERRRPARLPRFLLTLDFPDRETPVEFAPLPQPLSPPARVLRRTVTAGDLDINHHVNNVTYLEWAEAAAGRGETSAVQIDFLQEARLGEEIVLLTWDRDEEPARIQHITRTGRLVACVQWWRRR